MRASSTFLNMTSRLAGERNFGRRVIRKCSVAAEVHRRAEYAKARAAGALRQEAAAIAEGAAKGAREACAR